MAYEIDSIEAPIGTQKSPKEFDLPSKTFIGYDQNAGKPPVAENAAEPVKNANSQQTNTAVAAAPEAEPAKPEESVTLSPKIAAVARKEAQVRAREQAIAKREKELEAQLADAKKFAQVREKIAKKDFSAVEELGGKYEDHLKYATDQIERQDPKEERIRQLEANLEAMKKSQEEQASADYENNQNLWREEIKTTVTSNPDFAPILKLGAEDAVLAHINDSFEEDGVKLTAEQAVKDVLGEIKRRYEKFDGAFKSESTAAEGKVLGPPPTRKDVQTITQKMAPTSKAVSKKPLYLMSESEQLAEAIRRVEEEKLKRFQR